MSTTRDNHYVPTWYQRGFLEPEQSTLAYLDLFPPKTVHKDGRVFTHRSRFEWSPVKCFRQLDLYSTFFGVAVNDEIERRLFGIIDKKGAEAVRAFIGADASAWIREFETFFTYIDAQKIRTPKGLDWLKAQYPSLEQNELMMEMQGIRMMHCTIWSNAVREIVSAEESDVKFIISDHPVTIYNHALPPESMLCQDPNDPWIGLKASQTIFPLNRDFCLILTNLEYARDPAAAPLEKRTFARNFHDTIVQADDFVRERKLVAEEVSRINYVLKRRARRYIAAGQEHWLHPEKLVAVPWKELKETLAPPSDSLWRFGGEIFVRYKSGHVRYQDEFGREEKRWELLEKNVDESSLLPGSVCGCGSGKRYWDCCKLLPVELRPSWKERGIRERNLFLFHGIVKELGLDTGKDWGAIRKELTDEQISNIYALFAALWPRDTDLLHLLPKPDGRARAIYTGYIHPVAIQEFALGASLYFGEILIEHPFLHAGSVREKYSPVKNPRAYRQDFLKAVMFLLTVMPLVEYGFVNLVPDPCNFDLHLRDQIYRMAQSRMTGVKTNVNEDRRIQAIMEEDAKRSFMALPPETLRSQLKKSNPGAGEDEMAKLLKGVELLRRADPLAILQEGTFDGGEKSGLMNMLKLSPNFEMAMYLAQAIGGPIITDSVHRWNEIQSAMPRQPGAPNLLMLPLAQKIDRAEFAFVQGSHSVLELASRGLCDGYQALMRKTLRYATRVKEHGAKSNLETNIAAGFSRTHLAAQASIAKAGVDIVPGRVTGAFPWGGIRDNSVNRLLLMSNSEHHLSSVPMAFFIGRA